MTIESMLQTTLAVSSLAALIFGTQWLKFSLRKQLHL